MANVYDLYQQEKQKIAAASGTPQTDVLTDPYTRGIVMNGASKGEIPAINWDAETNKRIAAAESTVLPAAQAELMAGLEETQSFYQKQGKLSSSAATRGMMETSEGYALKTASQMSENISNIYSQIGQERASERANLYGLEQTGMQTASAEKIASLQARTQKQIAEIEQDTALTGYEKQIQIAKINAEASTAVASIQKQAAVEVQELKGEQSIQIQANEFEFQTNPNTGNPWTWDEFKTSLSQNQLQFDLTQAADSEQFYASLKQMKSQYELEDSRIRELAEAQIKEQAREFNLSTTQDQDQFQQNLDLARDYFDSEKAWKSWEQDMAESQMRESIRQFDLTQGAQVEQFNTSLEWAKNSKLMDDTLARDLQMDAIAEQSRQFNVSNASDMQKWSRQFHETTRQFDLSRQDQLYALNQSLEIQREQLRGTNLESFVDMTLTVLNNEAVVSFLSGANSDAGGEFIIKVMEAVATGEVGDNPQALLDIIDSIGKTPEGGNSKKKLTQDTQITGTKYTYGDLVKTAISRSGHGDFDSVFYQQGGTAYAKMDGGTITIPMNMYLNLSSKYGDKGGRK